MSSSPSSLLVSPESFLLGQKYQAQGKISEAIAAYQNAIQEGYLPAHLHLAYLRYAELNDYDSALHHLKLIYPYYPQVAYNIAFVYAQQECFSEAIYYYKQAIQANVINAHVQLGYLYECFQEYAEAIMQYQIAISKGANQANLLLAQIYHEMEDHDRANNYYADAMNADFQEFYKSIASHQIPGGQTQSKLSNYHKRFLEELTKGTLALGQLKEREGDYSAALCYYQQAFDQGDAEAPTYIETLIRRYNNDQECRLLLEEVIHMNVTEGYYYLAEFYMTHEDYSKALTSIRRYINLTGEKQQKGVNLLHTLLAKT